MDNLPPLNRKALEIALAAGQNLSRRLERLKDALMAGEEPQQIIALAREVCNLTEGDCQLSGTAKKKRSRRLPPAP